MVDVGVTKLSSKGQVVIPSDMRIGFKEGEKLIVIKNGKQLIIKKADDFDKNLREDLLFAKRTEEAFKRYEKGLFKEMSDKEFLKALEKW